MSTITLPAAPGQAKRSAGPYLKRQVGLVGLTAVSLGSGWLLGALNAANCGSDASLISWAKPLGKLGRYGPYAQLATTLGLGWLATVLYIDAAVSPPGAGMLYIGTTSRTMYSMGRSGTYAFATVSLAALRRSGPERFRPYRVTAAAVVIPLVFIFAHLIVHGRSWPTVWRICVGIAIGVFLLGLNRLTNRSSQRATLDWELVIWVLPWLAGIVVLDAILPSYVGSVDHVVPLWWDLGAVGTGSLVIFYAARWLALSEKAVVANLIAAQVAKSEEEIELGVSG